MRRPPPARGIRRLLAPVLVIVLLLLALFAARLVVVVNRLQGDVRALQAVTSQGAASLPSGGDAAELGALLQRTARDFHDLNGTVGPLVNVLPALSWLPRYGGDLANAPALLELGEQAANAVDDAVAVGEFLSTEMEGGRASNVPVGVAVLRTAQARHELIQRTRDSVMRMAQARARVEPATLSPSVRGLVDRLDRYLPLAQLGLDVLANAPVLLGADSPRSYLVIAQNSDELRPTGGFISGVALVRVEQGRITVGEFRDSFAVDNLSRRHPAPPEALARYMSSWQWMFRDGNWSPDWPTTARQLMRAFRVDQDIAVDGVVAVNLTVIPRLVEALGPVTLEDYNEQVNATNVVARMQEYWAAPRVQDPSADWWSHRKDFVGSLFQSMMRRLMAGEFDQGQMVRALAEVSDTKDWMFYADAGSPKSQASFPPGGGLYRGPGDALMLVDTNVGFNKVDASVERQIEYTVTLESSGAARAESIITYTNRSAATGTECVLRARYLSTYADLQQGCYWDYVRVFVPAGSEPLGVVGLADPARDSTEVTRAVFGGYLVLPRSATQTVRFEYRIPSALIASSVYVLHLQKQSGVRPLPVKVRVVLPAEMSLQWASPNAARGEGNAVEFDLTLDRDQDITVKFGREFVSPGQIAAGILIVDLIVVGLILLYRRRRKRPARTA